MTVLVPAPYRPAYDQSDDYMKSRTELNIVRVTRPGLIAGSARRCGITRPGFRERATYRLTDGYEVPGTDGYCPHHFVEGIYVYDGGYFYEVNEWHTFEAEQGRYAPAQPPKQRTRKRA